MSQNNQTQMFGQPASHVKITQLQEDAADWLETGARSGGVSLTEFARDAPPGLWERMSLGSSAAEAVKTSQRSSIRSPNLGMAWSGGYLMLNGSEWRNDAAVSSLSDILQGDPDPKYLLSQRACLGILSRAEKRGRSLPPALRLALQQIAYVQNPDTSSTGSSEPPNTEKIRSRQRWLLVITRTQQT